MFAELDDIGLPLAFYSPAIHGDRIPADAVEITEAQWRECLESQGRRRIVVSGGAAQVVEYEPPQQLDDIKARRQAEVDARYAAALEAGMPYGGKIIQIRPEDQGNISAMAQRATLAQAGLVSWPDGFAWRMADDTFLPLATPADMIALATAAADEVYRLRQVAWAHKDAIDALADVAAVEAYDITTGWG